jgi:hypothetical protein
LGIFTSHGNDLDNLLGAKGHRGTRTGLVTEQGFNPLPQLWVRYAFGLSQSQFCLNFAPALTPPLHRFTVNTQGLGYLLIAGPLLSFQQNLSPSDQSLLTRLTPHDLLKNPSLTSA